MKALINTMNQIPSDSIGTVISKHRTTDAARRANDKFQRKVKAANGESSYIPTKIVSLTRNRRIGEHVPPHGIHCVWSNWPE